MFRLSLFTVIMFRPITKSEEERRDLIGLSMSKDLASSELEKCEDLEDFYRFSKKVLNGICSQMELFILDNYTEVSLEEWNKSHNSLNFKHNKETVWYGRPDVFDDSRYGSDVMKDFDKAIFDKTEKIESISFSMDYTDGDFYIQLNNDRVFLLCEEDVFSIYTTVNNYLKSTNTRI